MNDRHDEGNKMLLLIASLTTITFYRQAKAVGLQPGEIASIPMVAWGLLNTLVYVLDGVVFWLQSIIHPSPWVFPAIYAMLYLFLLVTYTLIIRRYWLALNRLPQIEHTE